MWTRQELKTNAKKSLTGSYWMALLVGLIASVLTGSTRPIQYKFDQTDMHRFAGMEVAWPNLMQNFWVQLIMVSIGIAALVACFFRIFVSNVIEVGESRWFSRNRESKPTPSLGQLFSLFQGANWMPTVGAMLWMYFWLWLWSLLPLIPIIGGIIFTIIYIAAFQPIAWPANWDWGQWQQNWSWNNQTDQFRSFQDNAPDFFRNNQAAIAVIFAIAAGAFLVACLLAIPALIKRYAYRMTPWILADNPRIGFRRALKLSRRMTRGHKFELFILDLSFIGWYLLGLILFVVGVVFVRPYYKATIAELYAVLRKNSVDLGLASMEDYGFFAVAQSQPAQAQTHPEDQGE
jgi:uncharacterized membrane protein